MEKSHKILVNMDKAIQRELAKAAGFYDGRFRNRVVKDKKKEQSKRACREKLYT
jgi:hypothetical protein